MVNINSVYQKVLAIANKEQRGYITPQEFNLFASQAQMEIIDQYYYDLSQFGKRRQGDETGYSEMTHVIEEKIGALTTYHEFIGAGKNTRNDWPTNTGIPNFHKFPNNLYKLGNVWKETGPYGDYLLDQITMEEAIKYSQCAFTRFGYHNLAYTITTGVADNTNMHPNNQFFNNPYVVNNERVRGIKIWDNPWRLGDEGASIPYTGNCMGCAGVKISYVKIPETPQWGFVVVNDRALHDPNPAKTTNFELHPSEETELVYKILKLAGLAIKRDDIKQGAQGLETMNIQQEKQ
tara:strand:- start:457 stop:1332 length:876 start_codon:yes stop_codon:yes gene_type:complete